MIRNMTDKKIGYGEIIREIRELIDLIRGCKSNDNFIKNLNATNGG